MFNSYGSALYLNEMENSTRSEKETMYSKAVKQFAIKQSYFSYKGYENLRKTFTLPTAQSLRRYMSHIECEEGFLEGIIATIKLRMEKGTYQRECIALLDEITLHKGLSYL